MPKKSKKKSGRPKLRFTYRDLLLLLLGFCVPFLCYLFYLDYQVRDKFEGRRFSLPAHVFARPLELFEGKRISEQQLLYELDVLDYSAVDSPNRPGQYRHDDHQFTVFIRPFTFWDDKQPALTVSFSIDDGIIRSLVNEDRSEALNLIRLDPLKIGGIYPNQGEDRTLVRLHNVPNHVIDSLIAVEDKRFYQHHGVDPKAVLRALSTLVTGGRIQGGSTITQQLVKNFYLTTERTLRRKVKEMIMAMLLEIHYDKEDILETYINEVYFGQDKNRAIHGFGLASQFYFSQSIEHLTLEQGALLVGMLKGPSYYNPRHHPKRAKNRRNVVLDLAHEQGFVRSDVYRQARSSPLSISERSSRGQSRFPAFVDLAIRQLRRDYRETDLREEGLRIFTTLDPYEQHQAEIALQTRLTQLESQYRLVKGHLQGAVVLVNVLDGEVKAIVGDRQTQFPGFNRALDAERQIGSLIKPAIYLTALESGPHFNLNTPLNDDEFIWQEPGAEDWRPHNYDKQYHGEVPLWLALANSYNVAAARLGTDLGVDNVMNTVKRLGVRKALPNYASGLLGSVSLSPFEVARMYHTIANGGFRAPFRAIREVTSAMGEPLQRYPLRMKRVVMHQPNFLLTEALQEVVNRGTAKRLVHGIDTSLAVAGKTGTTDDLRDSWFAGFSGNNVAVVWVGNDDNQSVGLTGATGALSIWGELMSHIDNEPVNMKMPDNVVWLPIDHDTGFIARKNCDNTFTLPFIPDSLPPDQHYCDEKKPNKVKSWFKRLFTKR